MPNFALIGPRAVPLAVSILLIALGLFLLRNASRGGWECEATDPAVAPPDLQPLAYVGLGLVLNLILIESVGFILASTVMFVCVAKGFGSRRLWFAALVGFLLALAAYYGFAQLLGLRMGSGLIEDFI
jgi:putative tricarboxylic transport membrane protein